MHELFNGLGYHGKTDFLPFEGHFSLGRAKNDLRKKKSTMLPQATIALAFHPRLAYQR